MPNNLIRYNYAMAQLNRSFDRLDALIEKLNQETELSKSLAILCTQLKKDENLKEANLLFLVASTVTLLNSVTDSNFDITIVSVAIQRHREAFSQMLLSDQTSMQQNLSTLAVALGLAVLLGAIAGTLAGLIIAAVVGGPLSLLGMLIIGCIIGAAAGFACGMGLGIGCLMIIREETARDEQLKVQNDQVIAELEKVCRAPRLR